MASEPKALFEVNAAKILAKLHLAGLQAAGREADSFIVNTGIKNDNQNAKPENPGNVEFDINDSQSDFEVGYVTEIKFTPGSSSAYLFRQLNALNSQLNIRGKATHSAKIDDNKQIEKAEKEFEKAFGPVKASIEKISRESASLISDNDQLNELVDMVVTSSNKDDFIEKVESSKESFKELIDKAQESQKEMDDDAQEDYKEKVKEAHDTAHKILTAYFNTFAGPDNVDKTKMSNLFMIIVSDKVTSSTDSSLVANYEIQPIGNAEAQKKKEEYALSAKSGKECTQKVCFKCQYSIQIQK